MRIRWFVLFFPCLRLVDSVLNFAVHPSGYDVDSMGYDLTRSKRSVDYNLIPAICRPYIDNYNYDNSEVVFEGPHPQTPINASNYPHIPGQIFRPFNRLKVNQKMKTESQQLHKIGSVLLRAAAYLKDRYNMDKEAVSICLPYFDLSDVAYTAIQQCQAILNVSPSNCSATSKYRTADGSCNNLAHPAWGRSFTCFKRLLQPDFYDGYNSPRRGQYGQQLPNPRVISSRLHNDINRPDLQRKLLIMQFGQFTDHDLTLAPMTTYGPNQTQIECCNTTTLNENCIPISIPRDDVFFSQFNQTCLNMARSAVCPDGCTAGIRENINQLTSIMDSSNIYGSQGDETTYLRSGINGTLKSTLVRVSFSPQPEEFLPQSRFPNADQCSSPAQNIFCYEAGDTRVNEQPGLTSVHTLWLRNHNYVAKNLQRVFPSNTPDEVLFQETRRIIVAMAQLITFREFLTVLLGQQTCRYFQLLPLTSGYTRYNPEINPQITNEFSACAFRIGHTLIQNIFSLVQNNGTINDLQLKDNFFFPFDTPRNYEPFLRGLCQQPPQKFDRHVVDAVRNHLYRDRAAKFGMDLIALNIQRGRERGIRGYIDYVKFCFNKDIVQFSDLGALMSEKNWRIIESLYTNVSDIDLFSGAIAETPLPDAVAGPTLACLLGIQFHRIKFGDRFFFEHASQAGSFTQEQLTELRKVTLTWVICKNTHTIVQLQQNGFLNPGPENPSVNCSKFPAINWKVFAPVPVPGQPPTHSGRR